LNLPEANRFIAEIAIKAINRAEQEEAAEAISKGGHSRVIGNVAIAEPK